MANKTKRGYTQSSGLKKVRNAQRRIKVLERKIRRWGKYREKGKKVSKNNKKMSRAKDWDVSGMEKQIAFLNKVT